MATPLEYAVAANIISNAASTGSGAYAASKKKKEGKLRAKETKRETAASLIEDALKRSSELEAHRLQSRKRLGQSRSQSLQNTADLVRGAFNI